MNKAAVTDKISETVDVDELYSNEYINLHSNNSCTDSDDDVMDSICTNLHKSSHPDFVEICDYTSVSMSDDAACSTISDDSKICQKSTPVAHTMSYNFDEIEQEARQICNLLPKYKYEIVYKALHRNYKAENRIELTLWDLLPNKRPNHNTRHTKCVTSNSSFILPPSMLVNGKNRRTVNLSRCVEHYGNNTFNQQRVFSKKNVFNSNSTKPSISNSNSHREQILFHYMQYLKYIQNLKQQKLTGAIKNFNFNQRNEMRKIFLESHVSNIQDIDIQEIQNVDNVRTVLPSVLKGEQAFNNALPSKYQRVDEKLAFIFPEIDKNSINQICKNLEKAGSICSTEQLQTVAEHILNTIIDFAGLFASIKANTACSNTAVVTVTNSSNLLFHPSNFNDSLNRMNNTFTKASNKPSISKLVFGGAKQKVIGMKTEAITECNKDVEKNIVLPLQFEELYKALMITYPQIDKNFIRQTCKNVLKLKDMCSLEQLETLAVETVLGKMKSIQTNMKTSCQQDDESKLYTCLSEIFPNADSAYLKKVIVRAKNSPHKIEKFIETQWANPTYPTKQEKLEKIRIIQQQMQCIKKFNMKQFLEIFPDPVKYFTNPKRVCKFNLEAVTFLTSHFSHLKRSRLEDIYSSNKFNLTLTVQKLENMSPYKKLARNMDSWERYPPKDIPLLEECAYILHREEICEYLNKLEEAEMKEFAILKSKNELLECQCCYDNECMPSKCSTCDDGHIFCNLCILRGTESQLGLGNTRILCFTNCDGEFTVPTLQKILPPTQFSIFIRKRQEAEVMSAGLEDLVSCPFCHFASIPPPEDKVFKCLNPECMKESCRLCKELNHVPLRCYEERSEKARLVLEEKMTEALVRKCYRCSKPYFKVDGCNKIVCQCGAMMCYICDTAIRGYDHFNTDGCPLHSDNYSINAETVRVVAQKTVEFLKKKDPHADIRVDDFLTNLPSGSHNAIAGRVDKVAKFDEASLYY